MASPDAAKVPGGFHLCKTGEHCLRGLNIGVTVDLSVEASMSSASGPSRQDVEYQPDAD